ncbi:type IV pili methyl-accepting chemotaxis transducer N-terminal domain-containing protein [Vitreoscilla massiliensis]|uniref:Type IV pili methyl-accepting chemotaxis transducer N-terminal domain-containing protein n=1 Tax=Vitreoscilla massiliensis TaxID=1689272 RepID=A0ABY4E150_9NEIS|nr:type IV pili methyl-accepting chemotaxis transducer N-terminal domain-containing protein [Vitreoscilla massiliensis]UOO89053.1 type IV pili methyl-accepting chemotaxis transducer N-terminal domain-containing protein [Vitreoscilla massiliensis]
MASHLLRKLIVFTVIWLMFALLFVGITLSITWRLEDRGVAINEAGSLRKQTYLMVALVQSGQTASMTEQIQVFENKMQDLTQLQQGSLGSEIENEYLQQLNKVQAGFVVFRTKLLTTGKTGQPSLKLLHEAEKFVANINDLVKSIEHENTRSIQNMRRAQTLLVFMLLVSAVLAVLLLYLFVLKPLGDLQRGLALLRQQQFEVRVEKPLQAELYPLSDDFNHLASGLQADFGDLQNQLELQSQLSTQLQLYLSGLQTTAQAINTANVNQADLSKVLDSVVDGFQLQAGSLRIIDAAGTGMRWAIHKHVATALQQNDTYLQRYQDLQAAANAHPASPQADYHLVETDSHDEIIVLIEDDAERVYGWLTAYTNTATDTASLELALKLCGQHLALKLRNMTE